LLGKKLYIFGDSNVSQSEIKKLLVYNIYNNHKINLITKKRYILMLKPELKNIKIYNYYDKIIIKLYERTPEVYSKYHIMILGIDNENISFPIHKLKLIKNIPRISYKTSNEKNKLLSFIRIIKSISNDFYINISELEFNIIDEIIIKMKNNVIIIWGIYEKNKDILISKFKKLRTVYKDMSSRYSKIEHIDMSYYTYGKIIAKYKTFC
jgi:hypothetical protein